MQGEEYGPERVTAGEHRGGSAARQPEGYGTGDGEERPEPADPVELGCPGQPQPGRDDDQHAQHHDQVDQYGHVTSPVLNAFK